MTLVQGAVGILIIYIVVDVKWPGWGEVAAGTVAVLVALSWIGHLLPDRSAKVRSPHPAEHETVADLVADLEAEDASSTLSFPKSPPVKVIIRYVDSGGQTTNRTITLKSMNGSIDRAGNFEPMAIKAHCHLRRAARTFLVESVDEAADASTGELIEDFPGWLVERIAAKGR